MKLKCVKSLCRSIYRSHAFVKGREYEVAPKDPQFPQMLFILDEKGHEFNLSLNREPTYYDAHEYFENVHSVVTDGGYR